MRASVRSLRVATVHAGSPAAQAGLAPGWELVSLRNLSGLDGQPMSRSAPKEQHMHTYPSLDWDEILFRDLDGNAHVWTARQWPFGLILRPPLDAALHKQIAQHKEDREVILEIWKSGDLAGFAQMRDAFAAAVAPQSKLGGLFKPRAGSGTDGSDHAYWGYLALAEAQLGNSRAALDAADRAATARDILGQASYSGHDLALECHARALAMIQLGDADTAAELAQLAYELRPDVNVTRDLARLLGNQAYPSAVGDKPLQDYPVSYALPCHDPVQEQPSQLQSRSLAEGLAATKPGQLLAVSVLGDYRSNYYYNEDIARLSMIHQAFPRLISEVHVIVAADYALDVQHRHWAEGLCKKAGLDLTLLFDAGDDVSARLGGASSPMRALINHQGKVLSESPWADESGVWTAVRRMTDG